MLPTSNTLEHKIHVSCLYLGIIELWDCLSLIFKPVRHAFECTVTTTLHSCKAAVCVDEQVPFFAREIFFICTCSSQHNLGTELHVHLMDITC